MSRSRYTRFLLLWYPLALLLAAILTLPATATAQTHPCDEQLQTAPTRGNAVNVCHTYKDIDGFDLAAVGLILTIDGTNYDMGMIPKPTSMPNAAGEYLITGLPLSNDGRGRGIYPVSVRAYLPEGESPISNVAQWQIGGPPTAPRNNRIVDALRWLFRAPVRAVKRFGVR